MEESQESMSYEQALKEIDSYLTNNIVPTNVVVAIEVLKERGN